jgi:PhnB protein
MKVNPYLNFPGNAMEALEFYRSVFGGEFSGVYRFKDFPMEGFEIPKGVEDQMMHISLPIGEDTVLMASDAPEEMGQHVVQGNNVHVSVHPDSREEADRLFNALSEGGEVEMPIGDQAWGDYYGSLKDRFGIHWMVNYHPPEE